MRQRFYLCISMLKESWMSPFVICGYLLAFAAALHGAFPFVKYTDQTTMNVLEPFIILCSERSQISWVLFGYLILMCNAPFINSRSEQALIRTTRMRWSDGMLMYLLLQSLMYYLFLFMVTVIMAAPHGYVGNMWSQVLYSVARFGSGVEKEIGLYVPDITLLQSWSVNQAAIHSFFLLFLYSFFLALILFIGNMALHWLAGSIIAFGIHFVGYMLLSDAMFGKIKYSLLAQSILNYHAGTGFAGDIQGVAGSYMLFLFMILLLCSLEHIVVRHCDLKKSISERL